MKPFSPLYLLGALGALAVSASGNAFAVDTSNWTCESCPFEEAESSGEIEAGIGGVTEDAPKFGDYTGLGDQGLYAIAGGSARYRNNDGLAGTVEATDLGLDVRAIEARVTQDGSYSFGLRYSELPHYDSNTALTPFLGNGGPNQTLPSGFPIATTADIPAGTLRGVDLGFKRTRIDADASWIASPNWSSQITARHEVRDGTQKITGSFYASAAQLAAPVDQVTDQLEVSTAYVAEKWQLTLGYHASFFRNGEESLTWSNPFTPIVTGANSGQLALAPDNQFHQLSASGSYAVLPQLRASANIAYGRMTQDAPYLDATQNASLAGSIPALPATSLDGRVNTFNGSLRLAYTPFENLRLNASYVRDDRDNQTASLSYQTVATDMFVDNVARSNQPFSYTQDRFRINGDYSGFSWLRASVGFDQDERQRSLQDTEKTSEGTVWGRFTSKIQDYLSVSLKLAHGDRDNSGYVPAAWVSPTENPYMRKYNQADRRRNTAGARADITPLEGMSIGLHYDLSDDDYEESQVGLTDARSEAYGADLSAALGENTQLHFFVTSERTRSNQAGSTSATTANWWARNSDESTVFGVGAKQLMMEGKLELGADYIYSHSRSDVVVNAGTSDPPFPTATTKLDSVKVYATYHVQSNMSVTGGIWHEAYRSSNWQLDQISPGTVPNYLSLGVQSPNYNQDVVRVALRYKF